MGSTLKVPSEIKPPFPCCWKFKRQLTQFCRAQNLFVIDMYILVNMTLEYVTKSISIFQLMLKGRTIAKNCQKKEWHTCVHSKTYKCQLSIMFCVGHVKLRFP